MYRPSLLRPAILAVAILTGACATIAPVPERMLGVYRGTLQVESERLPATLELTRSSRGLAGHLEVEDRLDARGSGEGKADGFSLGLSYESGCQGHLVLSGNLSEDGSRVTGSIRAEDCTGVLGGSFSLTRVARRGG